MEIEEYLKPEKWADFVSETISPLSQHCKSLLDFWSFFRDSSNIPFNQLGYPETSTLFLGGTEPPMTYKERGLAGAFKEILGIWINIKTYYSLKEQGLEPKVPCQVEETEIVKFLREVQKKTQRIEEVAKGKGFLKQGVGEATKRDEYLHHPEKVFEYLSKVIELCMNISPGVNELSTFIWTIRKITKELLIQTYPVLSEPEREDFLQRYLGLQEYYTPQLAEYSDCLIYSFPDFASQYRDWGEPVKDLGPFTLGGQLCWLIETIWRGFESTKLLLAKFIEPAPELKNTYAARSQELLSQQGWTEEPSFLQREKAERIKMTDPIYPDKTEYSISEALITNSITDGIFKSGRSFYFSEELNWPFFTFLRWIMPAVFYGKYELVFNDKKDKFIILRRW